MTSTDFSREAGRSQRGSGCRWRRIASLRAASYAKPANATSMSSEIPSGLIAPMVAPRRRPTVDRRQALLSGPWNPENRYAAMLTSPGGPARPHAPPCFAPRSPERARMSAKPPGPHDDQVASFLVCGLGDPGARVPDVAMLASVHARLGKNRARRRERLLAALAVVAVERPARHELDIARDGRCTLINWTSSLRGARRFGPARRRGARRARHARSRRPPAGPVAVCPGRARRRMRAARAARARTRRQPAEQHDADRRGTGTT